MPGMHAGILSRMRKEVFQQYDSEWGTLLLRKFAQDHDIDANTFSELMGEIVWPELEHDVLNDISKGIADLYRKIRVCMRLLKNGMKLLQGEALISEITGIWEEYDPRWVWKEMRDNIPEVAFLRYENLGDYVTREAPDILNDSDDTEFQQMCTFWNRAVSLLRRIELELMEQVYKRKLALGMSLHKRLGETASIGVLKQDLLQFLCKFV